MNSEQRVGCHFFKLFINPNNIFLISSILTIILILELLIYLNLLLAYKWLPPNLYFFYIQINLHVSGFSAHY